MPAQTIASPPPVLNSNNSATAQDVATGCLIALYRLWEPELGHANARLRVHVLAAEAVRTARAS